MKVKKHIHKFKVIDYDDADWGIVWIECRCGENKRAVTNKKDFKYYKKDFPELVYFPEGEEGLEEILDEDKKALKLE